MPEPYLRRVSSLLGHEKKALYGTSPLRLCIVVQLGKNDTSVFDDHAQRSHLPAQLVVKDVFSRY